MEELTSKNTSSLALELVFIVTQSVCKTIMLAMLVIKAQYRDLLE